jgi:ComF family protein
MAWLQLREFFNSLLKQGLLNFACCDLCGGDVGQVVMANKRLEQSLLCQYCLDDLPFFKQEVLQANLLSWPAIHKALPDIHFDYLLSLTPYTSPVEHWLRQFKYQGRFELSSLFSALLCNILTDHWPIREKRPDLVLSVPLHVSKWQSRGYNQAHLIADKLSKAIDLPYLPSALVRIKKNASQVGKTGAQRRKNLRSAFALTSPLPAQVKHVLLVDDVVTTGSTASEISKLLKSTGIAEVTLVTVCLSLPKFT